MIQDLVLKYDETLTELSAKVDVTSNASKENPAAVELSNGNVVVVWGNTHTNNVSIKSTMV